MLIGSYLNTTVFFSKRNIKITFFHSCTSYFGYFKSKNNPGNSNANNKLQTIRTCFKFEFEYMYEWDLYHTTRQTRAVGAGNNCKILEILMKLTTDKTRNCYDNIRIFHQPIFHTSEKLIQSENTNRRLLFLHTVCLNNTSDTKIALYFPQTIIKN